MRTARASLRLEEPLLSQEEITQQYAEELASLCLDDNEDIDNDNSKHKLIKLNQQLRQQSSKIDLFRRQKRALPCEVSVDENGELIFNIPEFSFAKPGDYRLFVYFEAEIAEDGSRFNRSKQLSYHAVGN